MRERTLDEAELIARLKRRDEVAFRIFVRTYQQRVYNIVLRMLGDEEEARDLSQEVFVSVFRAIGGFRGDARLSTWLFRIATNHCRNRQKYLGRRKYGKTQTYEESQDRAGAPIFGERPPGPDRELEGVRLQRALRRAVAELSESYRELIVLRDMEHLSYADIQKVTGLPAGTVKSRLHRARLELKEKLAPHLG